MKRGSGECSLSFCFNYDGMEGSSGSHSPRPVAICAYLTRVMAFVITPCAASMENRPPDLRLVRVVHAFTGRVVLEAIHPRLWQVRVFLLKQWTWDAVRSSLPEGYCKFNVELIHDNRPLNAFRALMSFTLNLQYPSGSELLTASQVQCLRRKTLTCPNLG